MILFSLLLFAKNEIEREPVNQYMAIRQVTRRCRISLILILDHPKIWLKVYIFCRGKVEAGGIKMLFCERAIGRQVCVDRIGVGSIVIIVGVISIITGEEP